ncbi:MAG: T9SS type A sorting domain-containing protein [Saprospiraceae bacterium]|nr:T9SS type A sorting domain-containing protein [Saprospiraceae bacterium]
MNKSKILITFFLIFCVSLIFDTSMTAQTKELWGMTSKGGDCNAGTIFKTTINGDSQSVVYSFCKISGRFPKYTSLCEALNGKLYGMTNYGGEFDDGILFEYDPSNGKYSPKIDFKYNTIGKNPFGSLVLASNGKLYGMTCEGGKYNSGVIFEYEPVNNTYIKKIDLIDSTGRYPFGNLIQASNGKLYGMTSAGGVNYHGVIFEYDINSNTYIKKFDFDEVTSGRRPMGSLVQASNGKLYGMTSQGGVNSDGVIFEYDPIADTYTKKFEFDGSNGSTPYGSLFQASNGKLYGMTKIGGISSAWYGKGVLFEYDPITDIFIKKIDFDGDNKGKEPTGSLIQATNGNLYGMTGSGGNLYSNGVIFEYNPATNIFLKKFVFGGENGEHPLGSLVLSSNGKLFGMTEYGGTNDAGVLFEYFPDINQFTKKVDFDEAINGNNPLGGLIQASNGKLYGMTNSGGAFNYGILFEYNPETKIYTKKLDFDGANNGRRPVGSLIQASNGKLYGVTSGGGINDLGVLFEYDITTNIFEKKVDFSSTIGRHPKGSLFQASNGKLYGMTSGDDISYDFGSLFEYNIGSNICTKKYDFNEFYHVNFSNGKLIQATNGKLYGMLSYGGTYDKGLLFEFDISTGIYAKKIDFEGINGSSPYGSLFQASDGKLYGMTYIGGVNDDGVLFEYEPVSNTYTKIIDFDIYSKGRHPFGSLMQASNGKLYGMTGLGGINGSGVLFEYDFLKDAYSKKLDFDGSNGELPYGHLIEVDYYNYGFGTNCDCFVSPNPTSGIINVNAIDLEEIQILNYSGKTIMQFNSNNLHSAIDLSSFANGIYFVKVTRKDCVAIRKIILF